VKKGKDTIITDLEEDILSVDSKKMNRPFRSWKSALKNWARRGPIEFRRLKAGDDCAFDFLREEGIETEVLGPLTTRVDGRDGLKFLGNPPKGVHAFEDGDAPDFTGLSASHTINGHSVILRMRYGRFRFLFAGDLNHEAETHLLKNSPGDLRSEVFKVPHHGSADFDRNFIKAVSPVISVISSGDENSRKEHIHPRATLVGALGRFSRIDEPIILITELVAFFNVEGFIAPKWHNMSATGAREAKKRGSKIVNIPERKSFFSFSRTAFGIVKIRTDGNRLLVYTNSGQDRKKEVYAFTASRPGQVRRVDVKRT
ncbi:MAG: competence protein, partial [Gammaproteobacteria bacterium]|nr:competence protein [Gammaproteobacteria bacterium]